LVAAMVLPPSPPSCVALLWDASRLSVQRLIAVGQTQQGATAVAFERRAVHDREALWRELRQPAQGESGV
jgi:hypothetical protein